MKNNPEWRKNEKEDHIAQYNGDSAWIGYRISDYNHDFPDMGGRLLCPLRARIDGNDGKRDQRCFAAGTFMRYPRHGIWRLLRHLGNRELGHSKADRNLFSDRIAHYDADRVCHLLDGTQSSGHSKLFRHFRSDLCRCMGDTIWQGKAQCQKVE